MTVTNPARSPLPIDHDRLDRLTTGQEQLFISRQANSALMHTRALGSLAGGVTSNWQISVPQPIWISHGRGSHVWDVNQPCHISRPKPDLISGPQQEQTMAPKKKSPGTKDLKPRPVKSAKATSIKGGGKVSMQDFHFVKTVDKASP